MESLPHMYLPEPESKDMPAAVSVLHKVAVTDALNDKRRFISVGKHGVVRTAVERTPHVLRACERYHVTVFRAALSRHEVEKFSDSVHMGAFEIASPRAVPDALAFGQLSACGNVYLALNNAAVAEVVRAVADEEAFSVIKQQRGVYAALIDSHGVAPLSVNIIGVNIKIFMCGVIGRHHVEASLVIAYSGCEHAARTVYLVQHDLFGACQNVTYLRPVHKVGAFKQGHSGEILK